MKKANLSVRIKTDINASADHTWEILANQFADISSWTAVVKSSKALKSEDLPVSEYIPAPEAPVVARQTVSENQGKTATLIEVITMFSAKKRTLRFYGIGLPKFIEFARDTQTIVENGGQKCQVIFDVEIRLKGVFKLLKVFVKKRFAENFKKVQTDLKIYAESRK